MVEYLKSRGLNSQYIDNIHDNDSHEMLKSYNADVFLFINFDKIAKAKFLSIPKRGTFNVHLGKLPEYRGGLGAFWVLRFGDKEAGASIHKVTEELDRGDMIEEVKFPVKSNSMIELMRETYLHASHMIVRGVKKLYSNQLRPIDITGRKEGYHYWPTYHDFKIFYFRGNSLF